MGKITKHTPLSRIARRYDSITKKDEFRQKVSAECSTHPKAIEGRRLALQESIRKIRKCMHDIKSGKLTQEEEAHTLMLVNLYATTAQLEAFALMIDVNCKRNVIIKTKKGQPPEIVDSNLVTTATLLQSIATSSHDSMENTGLISAMFHDAALRHDTAAFRGEVSDENGVKSVVDDVYADAFGEEDEKTEMADEEIELTEEDYADEMQDIAEAGRQKAAKSGPK